MLLTRAECEKILSNLPTGADEQLQLLDYQLERDTSAVGYLGDYHALTLSYASAGTKNPQQQLLFVKALPQLSDEAEKEAIFCKEAWLYECLLPDMQSYSKIKWSAKCFYSRPDLCVLENIKLRGYSAACAPSRLLGEEQLHQLLRTLAAFHASSWVYEQRKDCSIGDTFGSHLREITVDSSIAWFTTGVAAILAVIKTLPQYQKIRSDQQWDTHMAAIVQRVYEQVAPSTKYRNVLCHRDLWAGNVFFPKDAKDAALLVDFQTCRYTPPAIDLCFSLYLNLAPDERQRLESNCIGFYYDWLQRDLQYFGLQSAVLLPKAQLLQSYEEFRLFASLYSAIVTTITKVPTAFITNDYKYIDRSSVILAHMRDNPQFREDMERCCIDVIEVAATHLQ